MHSLTWIQDGKIRQVKSSADTLLILFRTLLTAPGVQDLVLSNEQGILKDQSVTLREIAERKRQYESGIITRQELDFYLDIA